MPRNILLDVPLHNVMRSEIALPLQHVLHLYTVGSFLRAWRIPRQQKNIQLLFDTPEQAQHAASVYAAWVGWRGMQHYPQAATAWWPTDQSSEIN